MLQTMKRMTPRKNKRKIMKRRGRRAISHSFIGNSRIGKEKQNENTENGTKEKRNENTVTVA